MWFVVAPIQLSSKGSDACLQWNRGGKTNARRARRQVVSPSRGWTPLTSAYLILSKDIYVFIWVTTSAPIHLVWLVSLLFRDCRHSPRSPLPLLFSHLCTLNMPPKKKVEVEEEVFLGRFKSHLKVHMHPYTVSFLSSLPTHQPHTPLSLPLSLPLSFLSCPSPTPLPYAGSSPQPHHISLTLTLTR